MNHDALLQIPVFAALTSDELAALAEVATETQAASGDELVAERDFGHALYAITTGTAEVSRDGNVVGTLGPGDVFGEIAVLRSGRRTATVTATSPISLIVLFKRDIWTLERNSPETARRLRELIEARSEQR